MSTSIRFTYVWLFTLIVLTSPGTARAVTALLHQTHDDAVPHPLRPQERAVLNDPFFNLVLKAHANALELKKIEQLIQPDAEKRQTFVVHETITDPTPLHMRRSVLTFAGSHRGEVLAGNVMLSVFFDSDGFGKSGEIEAWGWDGERGQYNYYKLDRSDSQNALSWKFRGSSAGADLLTGPQRAKTCMACHINGGPVMKELAEPWNNWHSPRTPTSYLVPSGPVETKWPVSADERFTNGRLRDAEQLESTIISSLSHFNSIRINNSLLKKRNGTPKVLNGMMTVVEGKRLLRPLFVTTEINLASSFQKSGLHPFPAVRSDGPDEDVLIPDTFFLNAPLINRRDESGLHGLRISEAGQFDQIKIKASEYKAMVETLSVGLAGCVPGDTDFAWSVPEPSHIDNDLVDRLMRKGIISGHFLAAVLSMDFKTPILSKERETLLEFVPDRFRFKPVPLGADPLGVQIHPDELTTQVIAAIQRSRPVEGSVAKRFLDLLETRNSQQLLEVKVSEYLQKTITDLANTQTRRSAIQRFFESLLARRIAILDHPVLRSLDETNRETGINHSRLFPVVETSPVECP